MKSYNFLKLILVCTSMLTLTSSQFKNNSDSKDKWLSSVQATIKKLEYEMRLSHDDKNKFEATNRAKNLRFEFNENKFTITPRVSDIKWKVEYLATSISRGSSNDVIQIKNLKPTSKKNILEIANSNFKILYDNSPKGLRQDFQIATKPNGNGILNLNLKINSPFDIKVSPNKISQYKKDKLILNYQDLKVIDAAGIELQAQFIAQSKNTVSIAVNDENAKYPITIDPLTTTASWNVEQNMADISFGFSMAVVGDVNNDGYADVLIGAPDYDGGQTDEGKIFLYYGSSTGLATTPGWSYENNLANSKLGFSVDTGGKINNDLFFDFIAGAPFYTSGQSNEGAVYVFHGSATLPAATPTLVIQSNVVGARFGTSVSGGGKFNNDAFADIAVGAPKYNGASSNEGAVFIYHGATGGMSATVIATLNNAKIDSELGSSVKIIGDVNGDGYSDLVVSAPMYSNGEINEGAIYLYKGSATGIVTTSAWSVESNTASMYFGETLAGGDINKDGKTDLIVGAPRFGSTYNSSGAVYIYYSNGNIFSISPNVSLYGTADWDYFGGGLAAGDLNGDGHSEVIVGSTLYTGTASSEGKVSIYYGTSFGLETTPAWTKSGGSLDASFGQAIAVGDVNGDKVGDLIIASPYESNGQNNEGRVYAFYGSPRGLKPKPTSIFNVTQASSMFGFAVSSAGDVNNDGFDDVLVGAYNYDNGQTNEGSAFLFLGSAGGLATTPSWTFESNQASAQLGYSVAGNCDVNNDGYGDIIIGSNLYDNGQANEGRAYIFYGSASGPAATANWTNEPNLASAEYGKSVSCAGDTNGDGYDDILIGAPAFKNTLTAEGKVFLYRGGAAGASLTASWTFIGAQASANAGFAVAKAGDVNGDGYSDILIGAPNYDNPEVNEGKVFLFYGSATGPGATANWTSEGNVASAQYGYSLSYAGKLNNDNYGDFIIGAPFFQNTLAGEGAAFIYYGSATLPNSTPVIAYGGQANANFGKTVMCGGDADGDGYNEVVVAAPLYDNGQTNEGLVYAFQGTPQGITTATIWKYEPDLASSTIGSGIAGNLDINGDGYSDLVLGASTYKITNTADGGLFVFYGNPK